ncbi:MAG: aspartate kinase [Candidatus Methylarchaceae archaeon HK02M2]|nr:aspartate kinase [Candidatus Methylarchaceae archaeon HK02M2]
MNLVMKFGGSSVADSNCIKRVAKITSDFFKKGNKIIVVVSALAGVTDQLIEVSNEAKKGNLDFVYDFIHKIKERHLGAIHKAIQNESLKENLTSTLLKDAEELEKVLTGIAYLGELSPKSMDYVLSFGERLSASILWGALRDIGLDSVYLSGKEVGIVTDSNYGEARPLINLTKYQVKKKLEPMLEKSIIPVVTGYIASTQEGFITTLGRGGSDYSATIIGAALGVDEIWIWSDVDGMMTANPKIVPSAKSIPELSFQEAIEMAVFGSKGLHPSALEPAMIEGIRVRIKNTFNPTNHGTSIVKEPKIETGEIVKAVSLIKNVSLVNVSGAGMVGAPGTAAKIFDILGKNNVNVLMISQSASEANISFIIKRNQIEKAMSSLEIALLGQGTIREVTAEEEVCIVAIVGAGMKGTPGVASRVFGAVSRRRINLIMISQGSSEVNISFAVKEDDGEEAVRAIHEEFGLDK